MTTMSAALNATLRVERSSYTVAHLCSVNAMVIKQKVLGETIQETLCAKRSLAFVQV